jgi:hypothetical protein
MKLDQISGGKDVELVIQPSFNIHGNQHELVKVGRILEQGKYIVPKGCTKVILNKTVQGAGKNRYARVLFYEGRKYLGGFNL